jgi:hypothetical protein
MPMSKFHTLKGEDLFRFLSTAKLDLVEGEDWEGFYVNGKLVEQEHTIDMLRVLLRLFPHICRTKVDQAWLDQSCALPGSLSGVVLDLKRS